MEQRVCFWSVVTFACLALIACNNQPIDEHTICLL